MPEVDKSIDFLCGGWSQLAPGSGDGWHGDGSGVIDQTNKTGDRVTRSDGRAGPGVW